MPGMDGDPAVVGAPIIVKTAVAAERGPITVVPSPRVIAKIAVSAVTWERGCFRRVTVFLFLPIRMCWDICDIITYY